jgi:hypothetical protein
MKAVVLIRRIQLRALRRLAGVSQRDFVLTSQFLEQGGAR